MMSTLEPTTATIQRADATVFVVDDDPSVRKSLRWLMESIGLRVETFASAVDFLTHYDPTRAGCVVLDIRMPGMSGLELQERLRAEGSKIPIIVMTAFGDVPMAVRAIKSGAVQFFEKPVSDQLLLDHIQRAVEDDLRRREQESLLREVIARYERLTPREAQVLEQVVAGLSSKEIGQKLGVSFKTVEAHRAKIMRKMEADSVPHLIRMYLSLPETPPTLPSTDLGDDEVADE